MISRLSHGVLERLQKAPWLLAVPVAAAALPLLLPRPQQGSVAVLMIGQTLITLALHSVLAGSWAAGRPDADVVLEAACLLGLTLVPMSLLLSHLFTSAITLFIGRGITEEGLMSFMSIYGIVGPLLGFCAFGLTSISLAHWRQGRSVLDCLSRGWRTVKANPSFFAGLLAAGCAGQWLLGMLLETSGTGTAFLMNLVGATTTALAMVVPLEAWNLGLLERP